MQCLMVPVLLSVGMINLTSSHNGVSDEQEAMEEELGLLVIKVTSQSSCTTTNSTFTHNTVSGEQYSNLPSTTNPSESYEKLWTMLHVQLDGGLGILNLEVVSFWLSIMSKFN